MSPIYVLGFGGGWTPAQLDILVNVDWIAGGRRLLEALPPEAKGERIPLEGNLREMLAARIEALGTRTFAILASGDPLYHGVGGTLAELAPPERLVFHPAPTAFQTLAARLGVSWSGAALVSLHGQPEFMPWRRILAAPSAFVYGDGKRPAPAIAAELLKHFPAAGTRRAAIGCDLLTSSERVIQGTLTELAKIEAGSLSVLYLYPGPVPALPLGLEDDYYQHHKGMITHPEIRAIVLAKLRLGPGVLWDLGAGSGSVGLEAAGLSPHLQVHAVEKDAGRCDDIRANLAREGLNNFTLHPGNSLELLPKLPNPDRVFIGGGGAALPELLLRSFERLAPGGILAATAVLVDSIATLHSALPDYRSELITINISRADGPFFKAANPITLGVYRKP